MKRHLLKYLVMITMLVSITTAQAASGWDTLNTWVVWRGGW